jgi:hypothetical protein
MLSSMDNWGAFLFFAGWCFISLVYVFVAVPETAGLSLEHIDALFEGSFWQMNGKARMARKMTGVVESPGSDYASVEDVEVGRSGKAGEI